MSATSKERFPMRNLSRVRAALGVCGVLWAAGLIGCDGGTTVYYDVAWSVSGSGTVNGYGSKTVICPANKTYKLTALAKTGWHFVEWQGDITGTDNPMTVTVAADITVKAVFEEDGGGGGTVPTVADLTVTTTENISTKFDLVSSISGSTFSFPILPDHGILQLVSGTQHQYAPNTNFVGGDSFTYCATSNSETSDQGKVNVIVAPTGTIGWARTFGSRTGTVVRGVAVNNTGDVYLAGSFSGTVDFDPGPNSAIKTAGGSSTDIFVAKLKNNGDFAWVKTFGGLGDDAATCVAVSTLGKIAVGGFFSQSVTFGSTTRTAQAATDGFVLEFEYDGTLAWANVLPGTSDEQVNGVAFDASGNFYAVGQFSGLITLQTGKTLSTAGGLDAFIVKYFPDGQSVLWSYIFGSSGNDAATAVAVDPFNKVLVTGYYCGTVDFDLMPSTVESKTSTGGVLADAFVMKLAFDASLDWAASIGGTGEDAATCVATDNNSTILVGGIFSGIADFNPQAATNNLSSSGGRDGFLVSLSSMGGYNWAKAIGGVGEDAVLGVVADSSTNVYVAGYIAQAVVFSGSKTVTVSGGIDAFVAKYLSSGSFNWVNVFGGVGDDAARGVAFYNVYHLIAAGDYENSVNFRPGTAETQSTTAFGANNAFVEVMQTSDGDW
jgi:hypothetical protein